MFALALALAAGLGLSAQEELTFEEQALAFGRKVEETIAKGDPSYLDGSFHARIFFDRVTQGIEAPEGYEEGFRRGALDADPLGVRLVENIQRTGGTLAFLRILPDEPPRALFRLVSDEGLNYHAFELQRGPKSRIVWADVYIYASAEFFSETLRRVYLESVAESGVGLVDRLLGQDRDFLDHLAEIREFGAHARQGAHAEALRVYKSLPESVRLSKAMLLLRIHVAGEVDTEEHLAALADFERCFPDSPALQLLLVDRHILHGEWDKALALTDAIDSLVGGDLYLDLMRAAIHSNRGDYSKAKALVESVVERDPRLEEEACYTLADAALLAEDHRTTAKMLIRLEKKFGVEWEDLTLYEEFAGFVRSPEYAKWREREGTQEQDDPSKR